MDGRLAREIRAYMCEAQKKHYQKVDAPAAQGLRRRSAPSCAQEGAMASFPEYAAQELLREVAIPSIREIYRNWQAAPGGLPATLLNYIEQRKTEYDRAGEFAGAPACGGPRRRSFRQVLAADLLAGVFRPAIDHICRRYKQDVRTYCDVGKLAILRVDESGIVWVLKIVGASGKHRDLPGGKEDPGDPSVLYTTAREVGEELMVAFADPRSDPRNASADPFAESCRHLTSLGARVPVRRKGRWHLSAVCVPGRIAFAPNGTEVQRCMWERLTPRYVPPNARGACAALRAPTQHDAWLAAALAEVDTAEKIRKKGIKFPRVVRL